MNYPIMLGFVLVVVFLLLLLIPATKGTKFTVPDWDFSCWSDDPCGFNHHAHNASHCSNHHCD